MKHVVRAILVSGLVFAGGWFVASYVLRSTGIHKWADAQDGLQRLQNMTVDFHSLKGTLPKPENAWGLKEAWTGPLLDSDEDLALILELVAHDPDLRVWECGVTL